MWLQLKSQQRTNTDEVTRRREGAPETRSRKVRKDKDEDRAAEGMEPGGLKTLCPKVQRRRGLG